MVADDIALEMEKAILQGVFEKGTKLPPERKLADKYGASRTTVRQAIKKLEHLGLVETFPQSGTFISDYLQEASLDLLIHMMKDPKSWDSSTLNALMEVRKVIELYALSRAVQNASPQDIEFLRSTAKHLASEDPVQSAEMDYLIHYRIMKLSSNIAFVLIFNSFKPVYRHLTDLFFRDPDSLTAVMEQHARLIDCFELKNVKGAELVMEEILVFGEKKVKEYIDEQGA